MTNVKDMRIDHGLIELETCLMNDSLQIEIYDKYNFDSTMISLSFDEIREFRDMMNAVLELENDT